MILAAGLLVLLGLGSFVGGVVTGTTGLYWACVAACGVAAVVLVVARLRMRREAGDSDRRTSGAGVRAHPAGSRAPGAGRTAPPPATVPGPETAAPRTPGPPREPAGATAVRGTGPAAQPQPEPDSEPAPVASRPDEPAAAPAEEPLPAAEPAPAVPLGSAAGNGRPGEDTPGRRGAHEPREVLADPATGEPGEEDVEVTDLLLVVDLADEVLVVDEHPRYHLPGCPYLEGQEGIGLPMVEARADGFTPCATCRPVRHLADTERSRRQAARGN
ncbi:hypothetical protein SAMN05660209_02277 [Geodermatophilus africanus]|uniref:Uncharacterized protein n=1 Tax=Geodermatophilus africanus TaxID=1137993 RepID=A0A1H3HX77_9ACTN|nr:hypothetical protein [Geodermatophilus africanus]SDY19438.1 hypothetical protein SAMN05660209_02277 [Geodermatophilus africanus]